MELVRINIRVNVDDAPPAAPASAPVPTWGDRLWVVGAVVAALALVAWWNSIW